jgi:hypothetical protein
VVPITRTRTHEPPSSCNDTRQLFPIRTKMESANRWNRTTSGTAATRRGWGLTRTGKAPASRKETSGPACRIAIRLASVSTRAAPRGFRRRRRGEPVTAKKVRLVQYSARIMARNHRRHGNADLVLLRTGSSLWSVLLSDRRGGKIDSSSIAAICAHGIRLFDPRTACPGLPTCQAAPRRDEKLWPKSVQPPILGFRRGTPATGRIQPHLTRRSFGFHLLESVSTDNPMRRRESVKCASSDFSATGRK